jgi:hypothetical protein
VSLARPIDGPTEIASAAEKAVADTLPFSDHLRTGAGDRHSGRKLRFSSSWTFSFNDCI